MQYEWRTDGKPYGHMAYCHNPAGHNPVTTWCEDPTGTGLKSEVWVTDHVGERKITARDLHYADQKNLTYYLREVEGITFPEYTFKVVDTHAASMIAGWHFTVEYEHRWGGVRGSVFVPGTTELLVEVKAR